MRHRPPYHRHPHRPHVQRPCMGLRPMHGPHFQHRHPMPWRLGWFIGPGVLFMWLWLMGGILVLGLLLR